MYHQASRWCWHPSRSLFAVATSDVLTIYSCGEHPIKEESHALLHDYAYDYDNGEFVSTRSRPNVPTGILDVACDTARIYVLYDPNAQTDVKKKATEIRAYDWEGRLVEAIIPDADLSLITLDVADHTIFGISTGENEPAIWEIQLP